jgi:MFS transporter, DHA2 family, multidrug resistance protein
LQGYNAREIGISLIAYRMVQLVLAPFMRRLMKWLKPKLMVASGFFIVVLGATSARTWMSIAPPM